MKVSWRKQTNGTHFWLSRRTSSELLTCHPSLTKTDRQDSLCLLLKTSLSVTCVISLSLSLCLSLSLSNRLLLTWKREIGRRRYACVQRRRLQVTEIKFIIISKPTGYAMHQQFNIQQLYPRPTLYLYVLYLSENKQRLVPLTA